MQIDDAVAYIHGARFDYMRKTFRTKLSHESGRAKNVSEALASACWLRRSIELVRCVLCVFVYYHGQLLGWTTTALLVVCQHIIDVALNGIVQHSFGWPGLIEDDLDVLLKMAKSGNI